MPEQLVSGKTVAVRQSTLMSSRDLAEIVAIVLGKYGGSFYENAIVPLIRGAPHLPYGRRQGRRTLRDVNGMPNVIINFGRGLRSMPVAVRDTKKRSINKQL